MKTRSEATRAECRLDRPVGRRSCQRCDDDGRCVNGKTHMWTERGEIVGECHCTCHMCQDVELPDIERVCVDNLRQLAPPNACVNPRREAVSA